MTSESARIDSETGKRPIGESTVVRVFYLVALLYLFILSITLLGASFKLFGREFAEMVLQATSNPMVALMIGILATSLLQSSSTTTSLIVGMVASGVLTFEHAVPMIMGANIGTTITNTIVSMGHISRSDEFRRAFAGSTVHDFFNLCAVMVLMPLQMAFNIIGASAHAVERFFEGYGGLKFSSPLSAISKPVAKWILHVTGDLPWLGVIISIVLLFIALRYIVKVLRTMVFSRVERFFQRYVFRTPALGLLLGLLLTVMVQSSSITTSVVVPLIGAGVISLEQVYPYMLGANVGTTVTAFLASFVTGSPEAVSLAFAHLLFNVYGIAVFWPLKALPIWLARKLSKATQRSRIVPVVYILVVFFIVPGIIVYVMR